jgi:hypothetical protein
MKSVMQLDRLRLGGDEQWGGEVKNGNSPMKLLRGMQSWQFVQRKLFQMGGKCCE